MGTKNNPGKFVSKGMRGRVPLGLRRIDKTNERVSSLGDCYANADPDEPMFVLLGRDPTASIVVAFWVALKKQMVANGTSASSEEKLQEARDCAARMEDWVRKIGRDPTDAWRAFKVIQNDLELG